MSSSSPRGYRAINLLLVEVSVVYHAELRKRFGGPEASKRTSLPFALLLRVLPPLNLASFSRPSLAIRCSYHPQISRVVKTRQLCFFSLLPASVASPSVLRLPAALDEPAEGETSELLPPLNFSAPPCDSPPSTSPSPLPALLPREFDSISLYTVRPSSRQE
ncbi:hypothetical protein BJX63DRAFT_366634 [Aspergillus granulosus]|uniref:Uncharacterized protein n=1 Tax=Aspergillus granulosus TaxID=176169 RepID=A0ABR4H1G1_9EURO